MMNAKKKELSEDEIRILMQNQYVRDVRNQIVHYTKDFYELAYEEKKDGRTAREILTDVDIDPGILGRSRVDGLNANLNTWLREYRRCNPDDPAAAEKQLEIDSLLVHISELKQQIRVLRDESDQLYNACGYYKAENKALKKKLCIAFQA